MKFTRFAIASALALTAACASAQNYSLLRSFPSEPAPTGIATQPGGTTTDAYYVNFGAGAAPVTCKVTYIPDFLTANFTTQTQTIDSITSFIATRGLISIGVASNKDVFYVGDNGAAAGSVSGRAINAGSTWTVTSQSFITPAQRWTSVDVLSSTSLVAAGIGAGPRLVNRAAGNASTVVAAPTTPASSNVRSITANLNNFDLYVGRNTATTSDSTLYVLTAGTDVNFAAYTNDNDVARFTDGGGSVGSNDNGFDRANNQLIHINKAQKSIEIYNVTGRGLAGISTTPSQVINHPAVVGAPVSSNPSDAATVTIGANTYMVVTDLGLSRIYVYQRTASAGVADWNMFD